MLYPDRMNPLIGRVISHRFTLSLMNAAILFLVYAALRESWFRQTLEDVHEGAELWKGVGAVLLGYGVVLEERHHVRKLFSCPSEKTSRMEKVCHEYGVSLVILGVVIEILAYLIKIPNEVLNTDGLEPWFLNTASVFASGAALLQFRLFYFMWKPE